MATSKKTLPAGKIEHEKGGVLIPMTVDRDTHLFRAEYAGKIYEHRDGQELTKIVLAAIEQSLLVEWLPVLIIKQLASDREGPMRASLVLEVERTWMAKFPDCSWKWTQWSAQGEQENNRLAWSHGFLWNTQRNGEFALPCTETGYEGRVIFYLPYSEKAWEQAMQLLAQIRALRTSIGEHLESGSGFATLLPFFASLV